MNYLLLILVCLLQGNLVAALNVDETLSDDEEFEILQDLILELDIEKGSDTEIITVRPGLIKEDEYEDSTEWDYSPDENLVQDLIDEELGEELVEIIQQREPNLPEKSNIILIAGISVPIILLLSVLIILVVFKLRRNSKSGEPRSHPSPEQA